MFRSVITLGALAAAQASFTLTSYSSKDCSGESSAVSNLKVGCNNAGDFSFSITAVGAGYSATSFIGKDCPGDSIAVSFAAGAVDSCLPGSTSGVPAGSAKITGNASPPTAPSPVAPSPAPANVPLYKLTLFSTSACTGSNTGVQTNIAAGCTANPTGEAGSQRLTVAADNKVSYTVFLSRDCSGLAALTFAAVAPGTASCAAGTLQNGQADGGLRVELQNPPAGPTSAASASKYTVAIFTNDKCSGTPGGQSTGVALGCTSSAADKTSFSLGVTSTGAYTVTIFAGGVDCPAAGGLPFTTGQLGTCQKDAVAGAASVLVSGAASTVVALVSALLVAAAMVAFL